MQSNPYLIVKRDRTAEKPNHLLSKSFKEVFQKQQLPNILYSDRNVCNKHLEFWIKKKYLPHTFKIVNFQVLSKIEKLKISKYTIIKKHVTLFAVGCHFVDTSLCKFPDVCTKLPLMKGDTKIINKA